MISEYSLTKANRIRLAQAFRNVPRVDISIECVLGDQMGIAYVDDVKHPSVYLIRIGPFHYFAGDVNSNGLRKCSKDFRPTTYSCPLLRGGRKRSSPITENGLLPSNVTFFHRTVYRLRM